MIPNASHLNRTTRSVSFYLTDQQTHQTCYAHVISKILTRFIFLLSDDVETTRGNRGNCDILYKSDKCNDIFKCLNNTRLVCSKENIILALLFNTFYRILTRNCGVGCGGNVFNSRLIFDYCKDVTKENFESLWISDSHDSIPVKYVDLFDAVFNKVTILNELRKMIIVTFTDNELHDESYIEILKKVLDMGLYLYIDTDNDTDNETGIGHALTITEYGVIPSIGEIPDEPYFIVKNSHGFEGNSYEKIGMKNGQLPMDVITSYENPYNQFIRYISFIIFKEDFDKITENFNGPYDIYPLNYGAPKLVHMSPLRQTLRTLRKFGSRTTGWSHAFGKGGRTRKRKSKRVKFSRNSVHHSSHE